MVIDAIVGAMEDFETLGAVSISATPADRIVVGILQDSPDCVALALGSEDSYLLLECGPAKARQIAASLLNRADSIEGIE